MREENKIGIGGHLFLGIFGLIGSQLLIKKILGLDATASTKNYNWHGIVISEWIFDIISVCLSIYIVYWIVVIATLLFEKIYTRAIFSIAIILLLMGPNLQEWYSINYKKPTWIENHDEKEQLVKNQQIENFFIGKSSALYKWEISLSAAGKRATKFYLVNQSSDFEKRDSGFYRKLIERQFVDSKENGDRELLDMIEDLLDKANAKEQKQSILLASKSDSLIDISDRTLYGCYPKQLASCEFLGKKIDASIDESNQCGCIKSVSINDEMTSESIECPQKSKPECKATEYSIDRIEANGVKFEFKKTISRKIN